MASLTDRIRRRWPRRPLAIDTERSALERRTIDSIQAATFRYTYKGYPFIKNPFEIALYTRLLDRERPRTIVEIGSAGGGGAVWLASQMSALGVDAKVISVDILRQRNVKEPNVRFIRGDVHQLGASTLPALLDDAERPFLVIDDGPHTFDGVLASLEFFHGYLRSGEYMVVEDGIVKDMRMVEFENGPNRAVAAFLAAHPGEYETDRSYCNFYGQNVTWATNGYLRKV